MYSHSFGQQNQTDGLQVHLTYNNNNVIRQKQPEIDRICRGRMQPNIFPNLYRCFSTSYILLSIRNI